jgi:hypothetical protein
MKLRRHVQPVVTKSSFSGSIVKQVAYEFNNVNDGLTDKAVGKHPVSYRTRQLSPPA